MQTLVDVFDAWVADKEPSLRAAGAEVERMARAPRARIGVAYVDLVTASHIGRAIVYDSGECDTDILSMDDEATALWGHATVETPEQLTDLLDAFAARMLELGAAP